MYFPVIDGFPLRRVHALLKTFSVCSGQIFGESPFQTGSVFSVVHTDGSGTDFGSSEFAFVVAVYNKSAFVFAQLFQSIRIEVNQELEVLKEMLQQAYNILKPGGRMVVISYHSLEDRLVKRFLKNGMFEGEPERDVYGNYRKAFELLQSKAFVPDQQEIEKNPRARSARMRVGIKV